MQGAIGGAAGDAILGKGQGGSIGKGTLVGGVTSTAIGIASNGNRYDRRVCNRAYWICMNNRTNGGNAFRTHNRFADANDCDLCRRQFQFSR